MGSWFPKWLRDQQHFILAITGLDGRSERHGTIHQLVMSSFCINMIKSETFSLKCFWNKQAPIIKMLEGCGWGSIKLWKTKEHLGYAINLHLGVRLQSWSMGNVEYPFIAMTLRSTPTQNASTCQGAIYGLNRTVQLSIKHSYYKFFDII